ncbi:MAG TPA: competence/damage-inducible protein A [Chitinophagales bacterium]|nr:competence/damage-inducible protein A [Chitinophagales bacterium]
MKAAILTIGDELLYGQTVNTNAAWMANELAQIGIRVHEVLTVSDDEEHIIEGLLRMKNVADLILITGGIGPTRDDVTKRALCKFFDVGLKMNEVILSALEYFFSKRGLPLLESNRQQANVPANCIALRNTKGTAWGMWFEEWGKVFVSMPGVPYEMKQIMTDEVIPKIKQTFQLPVIVHKHILTAAIPESFLSEKLAPVEAQLPPDIKLAYLPGGGKVKLRLTATGNDRSLLEQKINEQVEKIKQTAGRYIYGYDDDVFEAAVGKILVKNKKTLSTAESCTGGYIAHLITTVPGSSDYFKGSVVAYANDVKKNMLGVREQTLQQHGAVSEQTVIEMLRGVTVEMKSDYGIAVTGIAGPGGGTPDKPVGTVWIAAGTSENIKTKLHHFPGSREQNIEWTAVVALEMMRKYLVDSMA